MIKQLAPITRLCQSLKTRRAGVAALAAGVGTKAVTFTCNTGAVLVTITTQAGTLLLEPSQTFTLPTGAQKILWAARGTAGAPFTVTVSGGTLDDPIAGTLPSGGNGGIRILTVS